MFSRPLFRSSLFSDPFFGDDPFMDDWNELLRQQWREQQAFKQQRQQQQQQQQQPRIKQRDDKKEHDSDVDMERKYGGNDTSDNKCGGNTCGTNKCAGGNKKDNNKQLVSQPSTSSSGTALARPPSRSFWDLTSFPSWSGLTPQSIRLEWSGTEPSAKEYTVSAFLPDGINTGDVNISMDERTRMLTLKCQSKSHEEEKDAEGHIISSRSSSSHVERALQVPQDVDMSGISASKGQTSSSSSGAPQLVLHLPKLATPQQQPGVKQITIR